MFRDKTLISLNCAVFLLMMGVGMISALLPEKIINMTGSDELVGFLASAFALSYIIFQIPLGTLSVETALTLSLSAVPLGTTKTSCPWGASVTFRMSARSLSRRLYNSLLINASRSSGKAGSLFAPCLK